MATKGDGVEGFNNLMSLSKALEFAAELTINSSAIALANVAKVLAPEGPTGELRESIHVQDGESSLEKEVVADSEDAVYVEYGTGQRGAASDVEPPAEGDISYDHQWKGMAAEPFMTPAAERIRVDLTKAFEGIEKRLKGQSE